jgi:hypothetical protein
MKLHPCTYSKTEYFKAKTTLIKSFYYITGYNCSTTVNSEVEAGIPVLTYYPYHFLLGVPDKNHKNLSKD